MRPKIGFCFLTKGDLPHIALWEDFFKGRSPNNYGVYCHPKDLKAFDKNLGSSPIFGDTAIATLVPTEWAGVSLVEATLNLFEAAIKDGCHYVILLSESCCPLYDFPTILTRLEGDGLKSIIDIPKTLSLEEEMGLRGGRLPCSQWCGFNKAHVEFLLESDLIKRYDSWEKFNPATDLKNRWVRGKIVTPGPPDEWYFSTLFVEEDKIHECIIDTPLTYVEWPASGTHPKQWWKFESESPMLEMKDDDEAEILYLSSGKSGAHRAYLNFLRRAKAVGALFARKINYIKKR